MKLESSVRQVPHSQQAVYNTLSDLSHLQALKDRIPEGSMSDKEMDDVKAKLQDLTFDRLHVGEYIAHRQRVDAHRGA